MSYDIVRNIQSSTWSLFFTRHRLAIRRTITASVANNRHRTVVAMKAGSSEEGCLKFEVTPTGGVRAGAVLGSATSMMGVVECAESTLQQQKPKPAEQSTHQKDRDSSKAVPSCVTFH